MRADNLVFKSKVSRIISFLLLVSIILSGLTGCFPLYESNIDITGINSFLDIPGITEDEIEHLLHKLGIWESRNKYPKELSVGMRKRLGLARCLIAKPTLLLLDEPFAALDVDTKLESYSVLQNLQQEYGQTIIMITHDLQEAVLLGNKIVIASKLPFRINKIINVPFEYPRTDKLYSEIVFQELTNLVRKGISSC